MSIKSFYKLLLSAFLLVTLFSCGGREQIRTIENMQDIREVEDLEMVQLLIDSLEIKNRDTRSAILSRLLYFSKNMNTYKLENEEASQASELILKTMREKVETYNDFNQKNLALAILLKLEKQDAGFELALKHLNASEYGQAHLSVRYLLANMKKNQLDKLYEVLAELSPQDPLFDWAGKDGELFALLVLLSEKVPDASVLRLGELARTPFHQALLAEGN